MLAHARDSRALSSDRSLQDRLDTLERTVADLARELSALRAALDRIERGGRAAESDPVTADRAGSAPAAFARPGFFDPPADTPAAIGAERRGGERRSAPVRRTIDFESLIGRYGTLALASLTILMGVGAFLTWAIAHGKIGPGTRVFLGALGAAVVAAAGWRLRARGSRRFGSTLLALALALVHVDAWGAGPYLHLVPAPLALGVAAAASVALAVLAWRGNEEALFSVGVGGALIAPFVTSSDTGSVPALLAYGYVVLATGLTALRGRSWRTAVIVATAGCWLYTATGAATTRGGVGLVERDLPASFAVAIAWTALLATRGAWGARIARSALTALLGLLAVQVADRAPASDLLALAALGTATAYAVVQAGGAERRRALFTAALLPIALGAVAVFAVRDAAAPRALVAIVWTGAAVAAAYLQPGVRATHLMVAGIASGAALLFALEGHAVASCVALAVHAGGLSLALRRTRMRLLGVPIALGLAIATIWVFEVLGDRPIYAYTPFATTASLAAAALAAAWLVVSWHVSRAELGLSGPGARDPDARTAVRLAGAAVTFWWGRDELARAYSADVATFLLVLYYAVVGVAAIFAGRSRRIPVLRHVGLALAMYAALKAIAQASSLAIGLRVGSYFLAGLFLLAVAYWYRARDETPATMEPAD